MNLIDNFINEMYDYLNSIKLESTFKDMESKYSNILYHDNLYYGEGKPVIEDSVYDYLIREYKRIYKSINDKLDDIIIQINNFDKEHIEDIFNSTKYKEFKKEYDEFKNKVLGYELKVGKSVSEVSYKKEKHWIPMMSLDNTYNLDEICDFLEDNIHIIGTSNIYDSSDNPDLSYVIEDKVDGLSCDLLYKEGKLVMALTRGDGNEGEVITHKVLNMENVPFEINYTESPIHIRGEIVIKYSNWDRLKLKDLEYKNPRNAAAGIIRMKDNTLDSYLSFIAYEVLPESELKYRYFKTHIEKIDFLTTLGKDIGFELPSRTVISLDKFLFTRFDKEIREEIKNIIDKEFEKITKSNRANTLTSGDYKIYPTDGLVFKLNCTKYYEVLGYTAKFPKYHIAYKFKDMEYITRVRDIVWQVGRTGKLTPVVEIEPVDIDGSTITRVTAHNLEQMVRLGNIQIGKDIVIVKSAMVIPKIIRVLDYPIDLVICEHIDLSKIDYPKKCPSCGSTLELKIPDLICNNPNCRDKNIQKIAFYCGRDYMNIEGLSIGIITTLYDKGILRKIEDIYNLYMYKSELIKLDGFGVKSIEKLLSNIEISKNNEPYRLIAGLGYSNIGRVLSKDLMRVYKNNLENMLNKNKEDVINKGVNNVGDVILDSISTLFHDIPKIIEFCKKYGICYKKDEKETLDILKGKVFIFTGKMNIHSRKYYEDKVKYYGGNISNTVNKSTYCLVIGDNPTERKVTLANVMNKKIVTEEGFIDILDNLEQNK